VRKDDLRIECIGSIDELSSLLGLARAVFATHPGATEMGGTMAALQRIQRELFWLGAELATGGEGGQAASGITAADVETLDREADAIDARLPELHDFILPGGGLPASQLHVARAVCRRAERQAVRLAATQGTGHHVVPYLNRLSFVLFSMARQAAHLFGAGEDRVTGPRPAPGSGQHSP
jgi:cob(I)alamin adenosyltransferase